MMMKITLTRLSFFEKPDPLVSKVTPRAPCSNSVSFTPARDHGGTVELYLPGSRGAIGFQAHLDLSQPQNLARLQDALGDLLTVDVAAVGRIEVADHHLAAAQQNLAVVTGNRRLDDRERVVLQAANSALVRLQLQRAPGHSRAEHNES